MKNDSSKYFVRSIEEGLFFFASETTKVLNFEKQLDVSLWEAVPCRQVASPLTQALFGLVDEPLELRGLQEAEALGDGVEQQETVRPADGGLQRGHGAVLGGCIIKKKK